MKRGRTSIALFIAAAQLVRAAVALPTSQSGVSAAGNSFNPQFSADGQHLVFVSHANNLVTNDDLGLWLDVFVRDLVNSNTVLVSVSTNGVGGANWDANYPSVSSNGQFVAFASRASNLVPGDTNDAVDIFLRDVVAGTTRMVSVDVNGNSAFDPAPSSIIPLSGNPLVSADGRWVFFESRATNLTSPAAPIGSVNIYRRDLLWNTTVLVTSDTNGNPAAGKCELASITPDGRHVAFMTTNAGMAANVSTTVETVFVRDMTLGATTWEGYVPGVDERVTGAVLSDDGSRLVFQTSGLSNAVVRTRVGFDFLVLGLSATNGPPSVSGDATRVAFESGGHAQLWTYDTNGSSFAVPIFQANASAKPMLSRDGKSLLFTEATSPAASQWHLYLLTASNSFVPVSLNATGGWSAGNYFFSQVAVTGDGARMAFDTTAGDLISRDVNSASDVFLGDLIQGATEIISKSESTRPATTAFTHSFLGPNSVSADGRLVVSTRYDDGAVYRDTNGWADVFIADTLLSQAWAASIVSNSYITNYEGGAPFVEYAANTNGYYGPVISADGSTVAAVRRPGGLYRVNGSDRDEIVWEKVSNIMAGSGMRLASRADSVFPGYAGNGSSFAPSLSADGSAVVFTTKATDFVYSNAVGSVVGMQVVLRQLTEGTNGVLRGTNQLVSVNLSGTPGNGSSSNGFLSPNGRWIIFESTGTDLVTNATGGLLGLFARDTWSNKTYLVSLAPNGNPQWGYVPASGMISGNSRYVAFSSGNIYLTVHDLETHTSVVAENPAARSAVLDFSGRFVGFLKQPAGFSFNQVFVRDMLGPQSELASARPDGGEPNAAASNPVLAGDGRYIVFQSKASNLVNNDTNGMNDIFVRDRLLGVTMLVSANAQGRAGNGPSTRPVMAADGRTVVFQSFASDLAAGDYNDKRDLFLLKLGSPDTEPDGMDDDWELAYFNTLARDGNGDFDGDGVSDKAEFLAGTDPTNAGSVFRVLTVSPAGGGGRLVLWTGNSSRSYRVEYKDGLEAGNWTALTGTILWNGNTASIVDPSPNSTGRFYRAVRRP